MFTAPPDYEARNPTWSDFVGQCAIIEPVRKHEKITTKFGVQDCWEVIVWCLQGEEGQETLEPVSGIRIFASKLMDQLEIAAKTKDPMVGQIVKDGNATRVVALDEATLGTLSRLWQNLGNK